VRTVHVARRSVALSALSTGRFDLDRGRFQAKPKRPPPFLQGPSEQRVLDLSDATALATNKELSRVIVLWSIAAEERIERVQAVHEPRLLQELKCSIDSRRRGLLPIPTKFGKNLVRANRFVLAPYNLQNMPPQGGEIDLLRRTHPLGGRDCAAHAARVIVRHWLPTARTNHADCIVYQRVTL